MAWKQYVKLSASAIALAAESLGSINIGFVLVQAAKKDFFPEHEVHIHERLTDFLFSPRHGAFYLARVRIFFCEIAHEGETHENPAPVEVWFEWKRSA